MNVPASFVLCSFLRLGFLFKWYSHLVHILWFFRYWKYITYHHAHFRSPYDTFNFHISSKFHLRSLDSFTITYCYCLNLILCVLKFVKYTFWYLYIFILDRNMIIIHIKPQIKSFNFSVAQIFKTTSPRIVFFTQNGK